MTRSTYQDPVGRANSPVPKMRVADLVFVAAPYPNLPKVFTCTKLHASISAKQCAENADRRLNSCDGCAVGKHHQALSPLNPMRRAEFGDGQYSNRKGLSCIRCGKSGSDEGSRLVGRMRLVHHVSLFLKDVPQAGQGLTIDVSCFNREQEVRVGLNAKKAKPVRHACVKEAVITYRVDGKLYADIEIGMRSGVAEIRRLLARGYPDSVIELIRATIGKINVSVDSDADPLYKPNRPANAKPAQKAVTPSPTVESKSPAFKISNDELATSPAWIAVFGEAKNQRKRPLPPLSAEEDAAYRQSFSADEPQSAKVVDPVSEPVEPSVPVAAPATQVEVVDPIAPVDISEPVTVDSDEAVEDVEPVESAPEPAVTFTSQNASSWAQSLVEQFRNDAPTGCDAITFTSGFEANDAEPVAHVETVAASEPAAQPVSDPVRKPQTSKLTGKAAAKQRKREAREARQSPAATVKRVPLPGIKHTAMAVVQIAFELNGFKA